MKPCPNCQSDQFKKATLVYAEANSATKNSALMAICAPPKLKQASAFDEKQSPFGTLPMWQVLLIFMPPMIGYASAGSLGNTGSVWVVWGCVGFAYLAWKSWKPFKEHQSNQARALVEYDKCYMCLRCGTLSHPLD